MTAVVSLWHNNCGSSHGSLDERRTALTLGPNQPTWATSLMHAACDKTQHCHLIINQPKSRHSFIAPWRVEGCVDFGSAVGHGAHA